MLHSIRFKLSLSLLLLFIPFGVFLFYNNFIFIRNDYSLDFNQEQKACEDMTAQLAAKAGDYTDVRLMEAYLSSAANNGLCIQLRDLNGNAVWSAGGNSSKVTLAAKDYIVAGGAVRYILRVQEDLNFHGSLIEQYAMRYKGSLTLLPACILFIFIAVFVHTSITKPIDTLYRRMEEDPLKLKIGDKKYRKDEIGVFERKFDEMIRNLQLADQEQSTMLAAISHDLKTPLTSIITYTDRLNSGKVMDEKTRRHYYQVILRKAEIIRKLIDNFQDAYMLDHYDVMAGAEPLPAGAFWRSVLEPYTEEWDDVDAHLEFLCRIDENAVFYGDRSSLTRVIANIMGNAVKYGAHPLFVRAELARHEDSLSLKVENNGLRVPENKLPLLFDRFFRADASRSREGGGVGLGLYICRVILEKHGGSIRAYQPADNDFGIELTLPLADS